jgi:hypothetical protein
MRIIAAIDEPPLVEKILAPLGLSSERPVIAPARFPPQRDVEISFLNKYLYFFNKLRFLRLA